MESPRAPGDGRRAAIGLPMAADRPADEQAVQQERAHADEAAWHEAKAQGWAMPLGQAIAYALEETPDA